MSDRDNKGRFATGNQASKVKKKTGLQIPPRLRRSLERKDEEGIVLFDKWIDNVVDKAVKGDRWASEFVADRLEGKPVPIQQDESDNKLQKLDIKFDEPK